MYSDIFDLDQLAGGGGAGRNARESSSTETSPLVSFKAGKMNLEWNDALTKYDCVADTARGEVRLVWKEAGLQWQWYDRREKLVKDTIRLRDFTGSTFERVMLREKAHQEDRIYVWTKRTGEYEMYWMQDASPEKDEELVASVNQYLKDPQSAAPQGSSSGSNSQGNSQGNSRTGAAGSAMDTDPTDAGANGASARSDANQSQVDALSSILENLGMPQSTGDLAAAGGAAANRDGDAGAAARTLTLADLQGAMAGIQAGGSASGGPSSAPSLAQVVTPAAIGQLLENEQVKNRLMELLPEEQRSPEHLEENLRSPQVQQTLRSLTAALLPDDEGSMDGFYSVLANFSLDPADGQAALVANNPIQAFLDCVLAKVQKDEATATSATATDGEDTQESKQE